MDYYMYQERAILRRVWELHHTAQGMPRGLAFVLLRKLQQIRGLSTCARAAFTRVGLLADV
jgi:hypothetical protein